MDDTATIDAMLDATIQLLKWADDELAGADTDAAVIHSTVLRNHCSQLCRIADSRPTEAREERNAIDQGQPTRSRAAVAAAAETRP